ncbi:Fc.00g017930.m01.CDS01 [Cosmosporella sp. VM-42]
MATSTIPGVGKMASILVALVCAITSVVADDEVTTSAETDVPEWASANAMWLTLSTSPTQFTVIPLTGSMGLNESDVSRNIIQIQGNMIAADSSNYNKINEPTDIAFLSCDDPKDDSFIQPDKMLNDLMQIKPKAIVLYSTSRNWCSLSHGDSLSYTSIFSMADAAEASQTRSLLNGTSSGDQVKVSIAGNTTNNDSDTSGKPAKNNSAVAMSILYSITGLITLLFLIIIATGAVRAHRYPERYGPRRAVGGRPRQSRAKGLARAVLETLPIVKFGDKTPAKPDPELELETATTDGHDAGTQRTASNLSEQQRPDGTAMATAGTNHDGVSVATRDSEAAESTEAKGEEHVGCSICTEDFKMGEDVRVLPCRHQFHPTCIDPWLINVSGTCPLCRFDLRPDQPDGPAPEGSASAGESSLPPPLALDGYDNEGSHTSHRNRLSRLFDINRLRQATREEQMEALRQMRAQTNEAEQQAVESESRAQGSRFAERLKERFRIRTRAQPAEQRNC